MGRPTCANCGNKHFGKCVDGTSGCFYCGKDDHKVRYCPTNAARGRRDKKVPHNVLHCGTPKRNRLNALRGKGTNMVDDDDGGKL